MGLTSSCWSGSLERRLGQVLGPEGSVITQRVLWPSQGTSLSGPQGSREFMCPSILSQLPLPQVLGSLSQSNAAHGVVEGGARRRLSGFLFLCLLHPGAAEARAPSRVSRVSPSQPQTFEALPTVCFLPREPSPRAWQPPGTSVLCAYPGPGPWPPRPGNGCCS